METKKISSYVGLFKTPLQKIEIDKPTMYLVCDKMKSEADLILLMPGSFLHAYTILKDLGVVNVRIFTPSLRPEFISDVFNLYMAFKSFLNIKWVFPELPFYEHVTFEDGQIRKANYINQKDSSISISYIKNENVEDVYDIVVRDGKVSRYFSQYLTAEKLYELFMDPTCSTIEVPYSTSLFGGLTYKKISSKLRKKFLNKVRPHSFASIEEYDYYDNNYNVATDGLLYTDGIPAYTFEGEISFEEIMALFKDDE